jgi:hypothetical protein
LLTAFLWRYARLFEREPSSRDLSSLGVIVGLALVTRHDLVFLLAPPLAWVLLRFRTALGGVVARSATPLALWTAFSIVYHGAVLPPTVLSKLSYATYGDRAEVLTQGLKNLGVIAYDPLSIVILAAG